MIVIALSPSSDSWVRLGLAFALLPLAGCGAQEAVVTLLAEERAVEFPATVTAAGFDGDVAETGGYHLIVWRDGQAAGKALFRAHVSDVEVVDALEALGAVPGDALPLESWEQRYDGSSWRPDQVIEGPPMAVLIQVRGREAPLELNDYVDDLAGLGFDMRFGGHRSNIPAWRSGCVVCLYSCPGSKVGNARYTVRDYVKEITRFRVKKGVLPRDGTEITVRLALAEALPEP